MLSPHEFSTLMLIKNATSQSDFDQADFPSRRLVSRKLGLIRPQKNVARTFKKSGAGLREPKFLFCLAVQQADTKLLLKFLNLVR